MNRTLLLAAASCLVISSTALAQDLDQPMVTRSDDATDVEAVILYGRAEQRIGRAVAASEGAVAGADIEVRPLLRTAEILETVPGMIVTQHSGSGKANQYFLRGFNLDHGTDFGVAIDGVPMNFRTHGHGQGYLDINGLIPELVSRVDYRKGPYRADVGDFNLAGGAMITTRSRFDAPFVQAEAGDFNWRRLVAGTSFDALGGTVLLAGETRTYDGPWALGEDLEFLSLYAKHTIDTPLGEVRTSLSIYDAFWRPTEQIPERAIGTLVPDAYGSLDPTLRGDTEREILSVQLDGERWRGGVWAQHYDWDMVSNFTFFLDDPVNGDQLVQSERMNGYGGRLERLFTPWESLDFTLGVEGRYDDIKNVGLFSSVGGVRTGVRTNAAVKEGSIALYGETTWRASDRITLTGGLRGESYNFDVRALGGSTQSGEASASLLLPKFGAQYRLAPGIALYGNYGQGFHSNDARGVTDPVSPAPGLVRGEGSEIGVRYERGRAVLSAAWWWLNVDSELIYVGDAGSVEPSNASRREGLELTAFWRPIDGLAIDAVVATADGHFINSPGAEEIPGALGLTSEVGVSYIQPKWNVSGRFRYLGGHPVTEDGSVEAESTTVVNFRAAWTPGPFEVFADLLNAFDSDDKDIEYYYESFLPAIDLMGPVEDLHARAVEPRMIRVGVKKRF